MFTVAVNSVSKGLLDMSVKKVPQLREESSNR